MGRVGPGVNIDPVRADVRRHDRRMAVNDEFFERTLMAQEFLPNADQIRLALVGQGDTRPQAGMDENIVAAEMKRGTAVEEGDVSGRHDLREFFRQRRA